MHHHRLPTFLSFSLLPPSQCMASVNLHIVLLAITAIEILVYVSI